MQFNKWVREGSTSFKQSYLYGHSRSERHIRAMSYYHKQNEDFKNQEGRQKNEGEEVEEEDDKVKKNKEEHDTVFYIGSHRKRRRQTSD